MQKWKKNLYLVLKGLFHQFQLMYKNLVFFLKNNIFFNSKEMSLYRNKQVSKQTNKTLLLIKCLVFIRILLSISEEIFMHIFRNNLILQDE